VSTKRALIQPLVHRTTPNAQLNPAEFGIRNGISDPIGLPQISIAGDSLNFGGPAINPSFRRDTTFVAADTNPLSKTSVKLGRIQAFSNNLAGPVRSTSTVAAFISTRTQQRDAGQSVQQHRQASAFVQTVISGDPI
jgi:hypothetical protein